MTKKILVVEDSLVIQEMVKSRLEEGGYEVIQAFNGQEGLEQLSLLRPDLIISDVKMPVMDGLEFCRRVKADNEMTGIPFLILSALVQNGDVKAGLEAGALEYLTKPYDGQQLLATIEKYLK